MGGTEANFWRLSLATLFLAVLAHTFGAGLAGFAKNGWSGSMSYWAVNQAEVLKR
jgi:hypothetical protein